MSDDKEMVKKIIYEPSEESKEMSIIKDKRQYSIRIPKEFIDTIKESVGNLENLKFRFKLKTPSSTSKDKPLLTGELIYGN